MQKTIKVLLAVAMLAVIGLIPFGRIRDGGTWHLAVTVRSASNTPIAAVSTEAFLNDEEARKTLEFLAPPESPMNSATQQPFQGDPLLVPITFGFTTRSALLYQFDGPTHQHAKLLVIVVNYQDGKRVGRLVDIPELRRGQKHELTVEVP